MASELTPDDRLGQADLILSEVERLTRLFQNILEMARIDAGAVAAESRWTYPSEIVAAARDQIEHTLQKHKLNVAIDEDEAVRLDPRLTATAIAHVLENAAQYAPTGSTIDVTVGLSDHDLVFEVRDHGPGIMPADLPHLFDRFYRGGAAKARTSGTGMGLWITRGLLAVERGRVWAENHSDGGAQFTIVVPVAVKATVASSPR
jgi:two-component system sensor histidine kinase KdpD